EVEVVAAIRNLFGAFQRPIRDGSEGQPRRERHRLLGRSQQYVQAQAVEVDLVAAENADRIDQDQRIRVLLDDRNHRFERVLDAGAGFIQDKRYRVVGLLLQFFSKLLRLDGFAPFSFQHVHFFTVHAAHVGPALAKRAVDQVQHATFVADAVARSGFPQARAGRRGNVDTRSGEKRLPQL